MGSKTRSKGVVAAIDNGVKWQPGNGGGKPVLIGGVIESGGGRRALEPIQRELAERDQAAGRVAAG
ncbi:MAG: hypothetical protein FWC46_00310 [Actinomycetia bacterium]|nr:hypothetical protein [Actinomycetes bacterium]